MIETKESVMRVEDLKAQVKDICGVDAMMDEDVIKGMKEGLITQAKNDGEKHIEEVIDTIEKALEKIKNPEFKAIIAGNILVKCPIGMQKVFIEYHTKLLCKCMITSIKNHTKGNLPAGTALLAAILREKLNHNE